MRASAVEKAVFVLSLSFLAFLYGYGVAVFDWFPSTFMARAADQARNYLVGRNPAFVAPRVYQHDGVRAVDPQRLQPGLTLIASTWGDHDWTQGLKLVDTGGRVLHEWWADPVELFPSAAPDHRWGARWGSDIYIHGSYLFPNGDVLVNIEHVGTARLDACGRVLWRLPVRSHHSVARADDGSFWIPVSGYTEHAASESFPDGYPGFELPLFDDRILHVSENGEVLDEISILDVLHAAGLQRYVAKVHQVTSGDILHLNDVEPLTAEMAGEYPLFEAGDLLVSLRNPHLVFVFDPVTKEVKWHASDAFIEQHDPDFIGDGWIGIFDNNTDGTTDGSMLGGSRIVAIQAHTDSMKVLFPTERSDPFYSSIMGKWQQLDNGNILLTEAMAGRVVEVAPDGSTLWEWVSPPYEESWVPHVTEGTRYDLGSDVVDGWACANSRDAENPSGS